MLLLLVSGCHGNRDGQSPTAQAFVRPEPPYVSNAESVGFDIAPIPGARSMSEWVATYRSQRKTAKFRIVLEPSKSLGGSDTQGLDIRWGNGKFVAEPGSDASAFLVDLKKALQAKVLPKKVKRVTSLPFTFASLGEKQSRISDGGFTEKPPGNWSPIKIFIGEGDQGSEVYLNLNPVLGKGEFSLKDGDYGNDVLAALASVL